MKVASQPDRLSVGVNAAGVAPMVDDRPVHPGQQRVLS